MFINRYGTYENVPCGLIWISPTTYKPVPVPLRSVTVTASVVHAVAQVEISQVYANLERDPIEASYFFPVDSNGAVTHFHAELDGKVIKGIVKSNNDAKKDYEVAVRNQQTAFLGEEVKGDVFKLKIGFLKPGAIAKVVIGYVSEVKNDPDSHAIHFFIPTTVAPRYVPSTDKTEGGSDLASMVFSDTSPAPMNIKVIVSMQGEIKSVDSLSSHKIIVESRGPIPEQPGWNKTVVSLDGNVTEMNRDFVLLVTPTEPVMKPRVYHEVLDNGSMAAMLHMIPSFALKEEKVELIVVVDRSGSMGGQSIRMASAALQLFVHSLPSDCYFNVVGFGSSYQFLFNEGSCKYTQQSLDEAETNAKNLQADLGGTEILAPLTDIYSQPPIPGYLRQIFVITDGEVSNTDQVIGLVKRNAHNSRLFSLGIGVCSSRHLVQGIAAAGGGTCAFVEGDESIHKATLSQLKNALQPSLTDVKVEWVGVGEQAPVELNPEKTLFGYNKPLHPTVEGDTPAFSQAPKNVPPIFDGNQMVVFGIFPPTKEKPTGVKITANSPDGPLTLEVSMNENNNLGRTEMIHKLAVIKLIRELELVETEMRNGNGLEKEIIALGVEHGITSKHTSFIAVDDKGQEQFNWGAMQNRQIPSQLPVGYSPNSFLSMTSSTRYFAFGLPSRSPSPPSYSNTNSILWDEASSCMFPAVACFPTRDEDREQQQLSYHYPQKSNLSGLCNKEDDLVWEDYSNWGSSPAPPQEKKGKGRHRRKRIQCDSFLLQTNAKVDEGSAKVGQSNSNISHAQRVTEIVNQQNFDGSFCLTQSLCLAIRLPYEVVVEEASINGWDQNLWATLLAIACLAMTELNDAKELWELAVNKAEKWMVQTCLDPDMLQAMRTRGASMFWQH